MLVNLSDDFVVQLIKLADEIAGEKVDKILIDESDEVIDDKTKKEQ